jgi:HD-GYP domain-containing protein (c-di-GMP phosphodiesterase class II)
MANGTAVRRASWPRRLPRRGRAPLIAAGICITAIIALMQVFPPLLLRQVELGLYDNLLAARRVPPQSDAPVLVGIDEPSLAAFGQWPWPRYRLAMLVERLQQMGAAVVVLDFLMPESDRSSPEVIRAERQRDLTERRGGGSVSEPDSNSQRLAQALRNGPSALGYYLVFSGAPSPASLRPAPAVPEGTVLIGAEGGMPGWPRADGELRSLPVLTSAASAEGFTNATHDLDGVLRRVPLLLPVDGSAKPSLALSALLLMTPDRRLRLAREGSETFLHWGNRHIPLDESGNMLLDFRSGDTPFKYLSAQAVMRGDVPAPTVKGRIVLIGGWARGLGDTHTVPSGRAMDGLEVHATVIDDILAGSFIARPAWTRGAELVAIAVLGLGSTLLFSRSGFVLSAIAVLIGTAGCYWASREILAAEGLYLSPLLPMASPVAVMTLLSLLKYGIEARRLRRRTQDLLEAQDTIILSMSALAETRDRETGKHILRTRRYVNILAEQLRRTPKYAALDNADVDLLSKSAPLHDIGKIGIPDAVLHKPGKLDAAEFEIMKTHTLIGADALKHVIDGSRHPERQGFLDYARDMIESHHEHWDGSGYPHGLRGEGIPLGGRLMALADVYDALVSRRVYKEGLGHEQAKDLIVRNSGSQFDPDIVAAFLATSDEFQRVAHLMADEADPPPGTGESAALAAPQPPSKP